MRGHWTVEARLQYVRHVTFDEDRAVSAPEPRSWPPQASDQPASPRRLRKYIEGARCPSSWTQIDARPRSPVRVLRIERGTPRLLSDQQLRPA